MSILLFLLSFTSLGAQEGYDYEIEPTGSYKLNESIIENGYVHVFSILSDKDEAPKYLIYLVKSSLLESLEVNQLNNKKDIDVILDELDAVLISKTKYEVYDNANGLIFEVEMKGGHKALVFLAVNGKDVYKLVFMASESSYEKYYPEFERCINTFKIL